MRVIALSTLKQFWTRYPNCRDAERPTLAWYRDVVQADWSSPADVKRQFGNASVLRGVRVVFNIGGNKYRVIVSIRYSQQIAWVRFVGTHKQYDQVDAETI